MFICLLTNIILLNISIIIFVLALIYVICKFSLTPKLDMLKIYDFLASKELYFEEISQVKPSTPPDYLFHKTKFLIHRYLCRLKYYKLIATKPKTEEKIIIWIELYKNISTYYTFELDNL
jgi:hypothetical protein